MEQPKEIFDGIHMNRDGDGIWQVYTSKELLTSENRRRVRDAALFFPLSPRSKI